MCFTVGRKHCGKKRKCWFTAFSSCPAMFSKGFSLGVLKCGRVKSLPDDKIIAVLKLKKFADDKLNVIQNIKNCLSLDRKHG